MAAGVSAPVAYYAYIEYLRAYLMSTKDVLKDVIEPALLLLPERMRTDQAKVMLLAIGLQESRFVHRRQIGGPARGFWQFEDGRLSGLAGLFTLNSTKAHMKALCDARGVNFDRTSVYNRLEFDDILAAAVARLLLWSSPASLPTLGNAEAAWNLYIAVWRPGKPHRHTWNALYEQALDTLK